MELLTAFAIVGLVLIVALLKRRGWSIDDPPSRWDCAELDWEHELKNGQCTICSKNFKRIKRG